MKNLISIYCDESCALPPKHVMPQHRFMIPEGISCPEDLKQKNFQKIKKLNRQRFKRTS